MKVAKASQEEIDTLRCWLQDREEAKFENAKDRPPAFMRVLWGFETLVNACCDPAADTLEWKPGHDPAQLRELLRVAKCPACDGSGAYPVETGGCGGDGENDTRECHLEQCRWCDERNALFATQTPA